MENNDCTKCRFYNPPISNRDEASGFCRRMPPTTFRIEDSLGITYISIYPPVDEFTPSCAEFSKK